jgi:hypothetical protein
MSFAFLRKLGASADEARKIMDEVKNLRKKPTQDIFKKKYEQIEASRVDKDTGGSQKTADLVGTKGEKVTVAKDKNFLEMSKTKGSTQRAKTKVAIEDKVKAGTATDAEKKQLKRMEISDIEAKGRQGRGRRDKAKPDDFKTAQKMLEDTGEMGAAFERLTKNEQDRLIKSTQLKKDMMSPKELAKKIVKRRMGMNKGGMAVKKRMGASDYRKGGYVLSSVDNRKKRK